MNIGLKQISILPITVKGELRKAGAFDHLAVDRKEAVHYCESFGTTGEPTSAWFSKEDLETGIRQIKGCGVRFDKEDVVLLRFPHGLTATAFLIQQTCLQVGATIIPEYSMVTPYPKVLDLMNRLYVTIISGSPREIELLAETTRLLGLNSSEHFPSLRVIIVTGEVVGERIGLIASDRINRRFHNQNNIIIKLNDFVKIEFQVFRFLDDLEPLVHSNDLIIVGRYE